MLIMCIPAILFKQLGIDNLSIIVGMEKYFRVVIFTSTPVQKTVGFAEPFPNIMWWDWTEIGVLKEI